MGACASKKELPEEYFPEPPPPRDFHSEVGRQPHSREERRCARDIIQMDIFRETCWCCYGYFAGFGCLGPFNKGCCLNIGECCCCAGSCKSAHCFDGDGCLACTNKCCCSLTHMECPPSNTPGFGLCGLACCCGNLDREDAMQLGPRERAELELLRTTCWLFACYCCMYGCNSPGGNDPACKQEGKVCCVWTNCETGGCCEDGWFEVTSKCCCCVVDGSFPAGKTPGIGCCGMLTGGNLDEPSSGGVDPRAAQSEMMRLQQGYTAYNARRGG